jgi:hypothetical protein
VSLLGLSFLPLSFFCFFGGFFGGGGAGSGIGRNVGVGLGWLVVVVGRLVGGFGGLVTESSGGVADRRGSRIGA